MGRGSDRRNLCTGVMLRAEPKRDEAKRANFAILRQILIVLKALKRIHRIRPPASISRSCKVALIGESLLDFLVAFRSGLLLDGLADRGGRFRTLLSPGRLRGACQNRGLRGRGLGCHPLRWERFSPRLRSRLYGRFSGCGFRCVGLRSRAHHKRRRQRQNKSESSLDAQDSSLTAFGSAKDAPGWDAGSR